MITPYYYLIPDRLQLGFQYQYAGSTGAEGVRTSSRYLRRNHADPTVDVGGGRGNRHHLLVRLPYLFLKLTDQFKPIKNVDDPYGRPHFLILKLRRN